MTAHNRLFWRKYYQKRLIEPLHGLLGGGLAPTALARALAMGVVLGCMPLVWGTSVFCFGAALLLRLNPLAVQVGNFAAWPLQILFAYPYLRLGTAWFGPLPPPVDPGPSDWMYTLFRANGAALGAWVVTVPLLLVACYPASRLLVASFGRFAPGQRTGVRGSDGESTATRP